MKIKKTLMLLIFIHFVLLAACSDKDVTDKAQEIAKEGQQAIEEMEAKYGNTDELLPEVPNTQVSVNFSGYSDRVFDKVYRYQANVGDRATFIWMSLDNNDMDEQHIAVTLDLTGISGNGEYVLDRQRNGNIYIEIDGLAFRTDEGNGMVTITSSSGEFLEGTFSAENVKRTQNRGNETINISNATFRLPLNDMRRD